MLEIKCQRHKSNVTSGLHPSEGKHIFFLHKILRIPIRKKKEAKLSNPKWIAVPIQLPSI